MRKLILVLAVLGLIWAQAARAADPLDAISKAHAGYVAGEYTESIVQLRTALEEVWNRAPLTVHNVTFVTERPQAYGMYEPRESNVFDGVDPILLYCEPVGYTVVKEAEFYRFALSADFSVLGPEDRVLGGQQNFGQWQMESRALNTEFMMYFTFNFKGIPKGEYKVQVTLHDQNSDKTVSFTQPFEIR